MLVWRNGRRTGLKIPRGQLHVGSTPTTSTKKNNSSFELFFCFLIFSFFFFRSYFSMRDFESRGTSNSCRSQTANKSLPALAKNDHLKKIFAKILAIC